MDIATVQNTQTANAGATQTTTVVTTTVASEAGVSSVLGGENVTVRKTTDFEKLLAKLEMEAEEKREDIFRQLFQSALTVMNAQYAKADAIQRAAIGGVNEAINNYKAAADDYQKAVAEHAAAVEVLDALNKELEVLLESLVTTPEKRAAQLKMEENAAIGTSDPENPDPETDPENPANPENLEPIVNPEDPTTDPEEPATDPEEPEIDPETQATIDELRELIAEQEGVVKEKAAAVDAAQAASDAAAQAVLDAATHLDGVGVVVLTTSALTLAKELAQAAAEKDDGGEVEDKANAMVKALGEYVDKIEEMNDEERAEVVAKVTDDFLFLARASFSVPAAELPDYEKRV